MKKIIPALCLLLVSAVVMATASFAWFSMNTEVTATGMQVTAKTNGVFLQIKKLGGEVEGDGLKATATVQNAEVYPAKYTGSGDAWQYAYSDKYDVATAAEINGETYRNVKEEDKDKYRLANSFTIFTKDPDTAVTNLQVQGYTLEGTSEFIDAVGIVIVCGDTVVKIPSSDVTSGTAVTVDQLLAASVDHNGVQVDVYVYFDGDNALVTSERAAVEGNLEGINVELVFTSTADL